MQVTATCGCMAGEERGMSETGATDIFISCLCLNFERSNIVSAHAGIAALPRLICVSAFRQGARLPLSSHLFTTHLRADFSIEQSHRSVCYVMLLCHLQLYSLHSLQVPM